MINCLMDRMRIVDNMLHSSNKKLLDININFEKNKKYAIVGSSGSGKTTLLRLILGLYKDIQGNILANTENLKNISLTEWREHYISSQK